MLRSFVVILILSRSSSRSYHSPHSSRLLYHLINGHIAAIASAGRPTPGPAPGSILSLIESPPCLPDKKRIKVGKPAQLSWEALYISSCTKGQGSRKQSGIFGGCRSSCKKFKNLKMTWKTCHRRCLASHNLNLFFSQYGACRGKCWITLLLSK